MIGQKYGKLTVIEMIYDNKRKQYSKCLCICECGNKIIKDSYSLRNPKTNKLPSCGCNIIEYKRKEYTNHIIGKKYNKLLILEEIWEYPKSKNKLRCKCDCGNEIIVSRNDVITNHTKSCGCLQKEIMRKIRTTNDSGYISEYGVKIHKPYKRNKKGQMLWECECSCGNNFYDLPARIKNGHVRSCGCLISSSMETYIQKFLENNNVKYINQYTFEDCLNKKGNRLRYDFAIINNNKIFYLIEYDGKQHFEPVEYFGGNDSFKLRQEYDSIKDEYCKINNIPLLRLPYYLSNEDIKNKIQEKIINILNP